MDKPDLPRLVAESRFIFVGTAARQDPGQGHPPAASGSLTPVRVDEIGLRRWVPRDAVRRVSVAICLAMALLAAFRIEL
jgi:hypothetical protein